jgi:hypothetical protein
MGLDRWPDQRELGFQVACLAGSALSLLPPTSIRCPGPELGAAHANAEEQFFHAVGGVS